MGGAGVGMLAVGMRWLPVELNGAPQWLLAVVGACFLSGGAAVLGRVWGYLRRRVRVRRQPTRWQRDYPWNPAGCDDDSVRGVGNHAAGVLVFALLLVPLNYAFVWRDPGPLGVLVVGVFDVIFLITLGFLGYRLVQLGRFGRAWLDYVRCPYLLGDTLSARFRGSPRLAGAEAQVELRCVREWHEDGGTEGGPEHQAFALYRDAKPVSLDKQGAAVIQFALPAEAPGTELDLDINTTYWEIVVRAQFPGVDYEGVFLVPVYSRDSA